MGGWEDGRMGGDECMNGEHTNKERPPDFKSTQIHPLVEIMCSLSQLLQDLFLRLCQSSRNRSLYLD